MAKIYLFILLCIASKATCQEIYTFYLKDKSDLQPIEQAIVQTNRTQKHVVSDSKGLCQVNVQATDTLRIFHLSYQTQTIVVSTIKNNQEILLESTNELLAPVVLDSKTIRLGNYYRKIKSSEKAHHLSTPKFQSALFVQDSLYANVLIKKIGFRVRKGNFHECIYKVHLYENSQGEPSKDLLPQEIIFSTQNIKGKEHIVDISDLNIKLPPQGAFIAVEFMAIIDKKTGEVFYETNAHDKLTKREGFHMPTALIFYREKEPNYWTFAPIA